MASGRRTAARCAAGSRARRPRRRPRSDVIEAAIASRSASAGIAQKIVSCMSIGGSAGLRMMIALPRSAPPIVSTPRAVVLVNSSMLARVPGPGRRRRHARHDLRVLDRHDPRDRVDHRDRGLPAAGDQADVGRAGVLAEVDRGHHRRADRGRGEVHRLDAELADTGARSPGARRPRWPRRPGRAARWRAASRRPRRRRSGRGRPPASARGSPGRRRSSSAAR